MADTISVAIPRPVHEELHRAQVALAAEAGKPLTLGATIERLLMAWLAGRRS